ncbi:hypothetical protein DRW48_11870 [Paracoccus suum]|uniref:Uncharacterized protein n=1 Tax=Paracoccus suum TaxID=2259340 RepID=A0A344PLP8_9RHOB|nr:hypothetical protein [Paracoccus suum]AXC50303.1 hypothetical protein DRW48_11870 [Paracoccus suum]
MPCLADGGDSRTRDYLLIRCGAVGSREMRLARHLAAWFGPRIRYLVDASAGPAEIDPAARAASIQITPEWLAHRRLISFETSGWRCGDYCYYAAVDMIPEMDRAWLIEADVWPSFDDPGAFFAPLEADPADFLAPLYSPRGGAWFWSYTARRVLGPKVAVHGCLFPLTRMTRTAMLHLLHSRAASFTVTARRPTTSGWHDVAPFPVPNDEAFVATVLTRDGFVCGDLSARAPDAFLPDGFTWDAPLHPAEIRLPALRNRILHPVLDADAAPRKLGMLFQRQPTRHAERRAQVIERLGAAAWTRWSGEPLRDAAVP